MNRVETAGGLIYLVVAITVLLALILLLTVVESKVFLKVAKCVILW